MCTGREVVAHDQRQHALSLRAVTTTLVVVVAAGMLPACGTSEGASGANARAPHDVSGAVPSPRPDAEALPFMHDDYAAALAESKRTKRPLFVDAWAPWCHSCLSMRAYVLTDARLAPLAKDFVWLTIDTEKDSNAKFVERFTNRVWPTLWVVDGEREAALLRWEGTATAPELMTLLATVREGAGAGAAETTMAFLRANQAAARGDSAAAEHGYRAVVEAKDARERPRALEALVGILSAKKDYAACTDMVLAELPKLPPGSSRASVLATGLSCARDAKQNAALDQLASVAETVANDPDPRTIADDRSALFEELVETRKAQGAEDRAKATAKAWASFLEQEASRAPNKAARAVFDPHRLSAYLAMEEPERSLPMLVESERDFPDDYNPPARLARAYLEMKRLDEARAAIERASARVYGPRSLRVYVLAADIAKARHDVAAERSALEQALSRTAHAILNAGQQKMRADLEKRLHDLAR